jgi:DNA (cytosine-5)-methyltransferase 1
MNYLSVCSGIEAASVAWHDLKWQPQAFSEIEAFPSAVLKYRFPEVPNMGDMTKYKEWNIGRETIDLIVGGTPCQSFSVAGLRKGLDDPRGNLMLVYLGLIDHFKPKWIVWENVPGVLSSNKGRDFGTFIGALAELRYGFAYRVLDAQFFGVPQRRRRVFVVGYLGDWRPAAAVLFESESLRRNTQKSRKTGKRVTSNIENGTGEYYESHPHDSRITGPHDTANTVSARYGTGGGNTPIVMSHGQANAEIREDGQSPTLTCNHEAPILAMHTTGAGFWKEGCDTLLQSKNNGGYSLNYINPVKINSIVRRLTPLECEKLQGFPDNWTKIPWRNKDIECCPDGPRYKAIGNSMAVPVMKWIGQRIQLVEDILKK